MTRSPRPTFSQAARRAIPHLLAYLVEDLEYKVDELPDRKRRGGHPMYRRLPRPAQRDLVRLVRWLQHKQPPAIAAPDESIDRSCAGLKQFEQLAGGGDS